MKANDWTRDALAVAWRRGALAGLVWLFIGTMQCSISPDPEGAAPDLTAQPDWTLSQDTADGQATPIDTAAPETTRPTDQGPDAEATGDLTAAELTDAQGQDFAAGEMSDGMDAAPDAAVLPDGVDDGGPDAETAGSNDSSNPCLPVPPTPPLFSGGFAGSVTVDATLTSLSLQDQCVGGYQGVLNLDEQPALTAWGGCAFSGPIGQFAGESVMLQLQGDPVCPTQLEGNGQVDLHNPGTALWTADHVAPDRLQGTGSAFCSASGSSYSYDVHYAFDGSRLVPDLSAGTEHPIDRQREAEDCSVAVLGFGRGDRMYARYETEWIEVELRAAPDTGTVIAAGMFGQRRSPGEGWQSAWALAARDPADGIWKLHFAERSFENGLPRDGGTAPRLGDGSWEFAFFADVLAGDATIERRWQSKAGGAYTWNDFAGYSCATEIVDLGTVCWVAETSPLLEHRAVCQP